MQLLVMVIPANPHYILIIFRLNMPAQFLIAILAILKMRMNLSFIKYIHISKK